MKMRMTKFNFLGTIVGVIIIASCFGGCSLTYTIKDPVVSSVDYGRKDITPITLTIIDMRTGDDSLFIVARLGPSGNISKFPITLKKMENPIGYFTQHLEKELDSRKIPVKCVVGKTAADGLTLEIIRYQIINRRATGFSPWEAMHIFSGNIIKDGQKTPIKAFFYGGKMPVWSMHELEEPCFNIPISLIIKDVASKINRVIFNYSAPDEKINRLTTEIDSEMGKAVEGPFWKVLELGYTNNPKAMEPLKIYSQHGNEFFKSCALSSIGTLGAGGQFEFLKQRYSNSQDSYNDRYMAVKAIGDIGSPEALQFIREIRKEKAYEGEAGLKYCVDLYAP
jgi:hypothetical protein